MNKEITLSSGTYMFIRVPQNATNFHLIHDKKRVAYFTPKYKRFEFLYGKNFEIISTTKDITEKQCQEICQQVLNNFWENYNTILDLSGFEGYETAKESLNSLIESLGLDINNNYLILKKIII